MAAATNDHTLSCPASQESLASYYLGRLSLHDFVAPPHRRPTVPFDHFPHPDDLPVVDFSAFAILDSDADHADRRAAALQNLCRAAEEWGFFRLINHDIPADLLQRLEAHSVRFFSLPLEQKLKISRTADAPYGYGCGSFPNRRDKWWNESLRISADQDATTINKILEKVMPDEELYKNFCADAEQYIEMGQALGHKLRALLTECLGLIPSYYDRFYERPNTTALRINYYPPCPEPDLMMGIYEHTDPGTLTILHQCNTGGLQVQKDGEWIGVKPQMGSLIVNLGDCFQVFSNGRFRSGVHRAVLNKVSPRLSFGLFYSAKADAIIQPSPPLLGADHPPLYRPITWLDYRTYSFGQEATPNTIKYLENPSSGSLGPV